MRLKLALKHCNTPKQVYCLKYLNFCVIKTAVSNEVTYPLQYLQIFCHLQMHHYDYLFHIV